MILSNEGSHYIVIVKLKFLSYPRGELDELRLVADLALFANVGACSSGGLCRFFEMDPQQFWSKPGEIDSTLFVGLESVGVRRGGRTLLAT